MNDQDFLTALDRIDEALGAPSTKSLDGSELCAKYRSIRQWLEQIIPFVKLIPVYSAKIALALTFLMTLGDTVCPA